MTRLDFRTVVAVVFLAATGCKGDPTADLRGGAASLSLNPDLMFIDQGASKGLEVVVRDQQLNPVSASVTATTSNAAVATVSPDTLTPSADNARYNFNVTAVGPGQAHVRVSAAGITDSATITVLPTAFTGTLSSATPKGGDTLRIASTDLLKFDTSATTVTFAGGGAAIILSKTPDTLTVLVPFGAAGPVTIGGINVTYVPGLRVAIATAQSVTQTGDLWAGDTAYTTAPTIPLPTVTGDSVVMVTDLPSVLNDAHCGEGTGGGATGKCTIFKYVANGTDSLTFAANWTPPTSTTTGESDIDIYSCNSTGVAGCFEGGAAGAAGASAKTPEVFTIKPTAGTHYLVIEQFSAGENRNVIVTITKKN
ncbi:MAG: hypothetical protein ABR537_05700 [Gemmatimonadales bacterium]